MSTSFPIPHSSGSPVFDSTNSPTWRGACLVRSSRSLFSLSDFDKRTANLRSGAFVSRTIHPGNLSLQKLSSSMSRLQSDGTRHKTILLWRALVTTRVVSGSHFMSRPTLIAAAGHAAAGDRGVNAWTAGCRVQLIVCASGLDNDIEKDAGAS